MGDVTDAASVAAAVDGCDAAIHAAAVVSLDPVEAIRMSRSNLAGVTNMLSAAAAQ